MGRLRSHWKLMADERGESVSLVCEHWWMAHRHAHKYNTNWTQQDKKKGSKKTGSEEGAYGVKGLGELEEESGWI